MKEKQKTKERGITLIALIVTIIVLIILSVVSINAIFGADGIISQARKTKLIADFTVYIEEKKTYDSEKAYENSNYLQESLNAGRTKLAYNTQGENTDGNIQTVIPSMTNEMAEKFEIIKGEFLLYASDELEREVAEQLGIKLSPYLIEDGVLLSANENLELQTEDGVVTLPERVTEIGQGAFSGVTGLKEVIIPGTVKVIGMDAFSFNTSIKKITIEEGTLYIDAYAFRNAQIEEIIIPDSVVYIGEGAFTDCSKLTTVKLPENLEGLDYALFRRCVSLTNINIPKNLISIYEEAFIGCISLNEIDIPSSVKNISSSAFTNCYNLFNVTIDANNPYYEIEQGIIYAKDGSTLIMTAAVQNQTEITIKEGIKELNEDSLGMCSNAEIINLPNSLEKIYGTTFNGLKKLNTINFPNGSNNFKVENGYLYGNDERGKVLIYSVPTKKEIIIDETVNVIGIASIQNDNITKLVIPDSVTTIESQIFSDTSGKNLKTIEIGTGLKNLDPRFNVWSYAQDLEVIIDPENQYYKVEGNLILTNDGKEVVTFLKQATSQVIPTGVEIIQHHAFMNFNSATEIILPNTLMTIEDNAFTWCSGITTIDIPNSVKNIADNAFLSCEYLEKINIDNIKNSISNSPWGAPKGERAVFWLR